MPLTAHFSLHQPCPRLQFVPPPKQRINHPIKLILFRMTVFFAFTFYNPIIQPLPIKILKKSNNE